MKILLIDDIEINLDQIANTIEDLLEETTVIKCPDSLDAETVAEKVQPDIIITDVLMPELDGIEVCERIRANTKTNHIPIIILSGSKVDVQCRIECLEAGADIFLNKPIDSAELIAQIKSMYRMKRAEDSLKKHSVELQKEVEKQTSELKTVVQKLQETNEQLRQSEHLYRNLFESAFDAIILFDPETGRFLAANDQTCKIYGYTKDELFDIPLLKLVKDVEKENKHIKKILLNSFSKNYQTIHIDKFGKEIFFQINSTVIKYKGKSAILSVMRDVTECMQTNIALKESEKIYHTIFESTGTATILVNDNNNITDINREFELLSGYSASEVINRHWTDFVFEEDLPKLKRLFRIKTVKPHKLPNSIEVRLKDKNGNIRYTILTIGKILNTELSVVSLLDFTNQKSAEDKIRALLEEKNILLREVHHRIKNNMAAIESLFRIQSRNSKEEKVTSAFMDAISRLRGMRVLYDKLYRTNDFQETSLNAYLPDLVHEIINLFPNSKDVTTIFEIPDIHISAKINFPFCIIVNEMLSNIMKYAFNNQISQPTISIKTKKQLDSVVITIADNGTGLPEDFNLDNHESFGINLIKMLSEQINAELKIESGNGTKWLLKIPLET